MAYYPPSQIKTNLYTGGAEFVVEKSKQEYIGYYYALSDGTFYSGKNPNNKPNDKFLSPPEAPIASTSASCCISPGLFTE